MAFGHVIEYDMKNIFLPKLFTKSGGETSPRPFHKKAKLNRFLDQQAKRLYSQFLVYVIVENHQNILKIRYWSFAFISYKALSKTKKRSGTSLPISFSAAHLQKDIYHVIF